MRDRSTRHHPPRGIPKGGALEKDLLLPPPLSVQDSGTRGKKHDNLPLLDLVESLELGNGDEDNNGLLAALDVDLTSRRDLEGSKLGLELGNVVLEVQESLGNLLLNLGGGSARSVGSAAMSAFVTCADHETRRRLPKVLNAHSALSGASKLSTPFSARRKPGIMVVGH